MKTELEASDIEMIAAAVTDRLLPLLAVIGHGAEDRLFDVKGLAEYLRVSTKWIYERTAIKTIPHIKVDGQLRFRKSAIDKWLDTFHVPAASEQGLSATKRLSNMH